MSPPSSLNVNSFGDEIVVGARTNGTRDPSHNDQSTGPAPTDGDETMNDAGDSRPPSSRYATRTRATAQNEPAPDHLGRLASAAHESYEALASPRQARRANSDSHEKGVLLGYWRDSPVEDEGYKHAIVATLDTRGRLRPRVQATSISGRPAPSPLPSGPGSTEVSFSRIVFMNHLVGLHHAHIVEYVRFRSAIFPGDSDEGRRQADLAARADADRSVKTNPPAELGPIAYGREIPEDVTHARPEPSIKRRRTDMGFVPVDRTPLPDPPAAAAAPSTAIDLEPLYGSRPTRVMVGYWKGSSEEDPKDRHAILGILGHNDMFRVKVVRETRDGRPVHGNFPTGAGALWVHLEEVVLDDHIKGLERAEIKEYVRIRQFYMDRGELPESRALNEAVAVANARRRVAAGFKNGPTAGVPEPSLASAGARGDAIIAKLTNLYYENGKPPTPAPEIRTAAGRRSLGAAADAERRAANAEFADRHAAAERAAGLEPVPVPVRGAQARQSASREAAAMAAASAANTHMSVSPLPSQANLSHNHTHGHNHNHHQNHGHNHVGTPARMRFHETDEMQRLNDIWARQEAYRQRGVPPIAVPSPAAAAAAAVPTPVESEEVKVHGETRYVKRAAGPFQGRFVAEARALITIEGEDYVEYRVLTKPM